MKNRTLLHLAGAAGALVLSSPALAGYIGLVVTTESPGPGPAPPGGPFTIYHVYAEFADPLDRVNMWGGGLGLGSAVIQNVLADGVTLGSGFLQVGGAGGQLAPPSPGYPRDWDTYMTVGLRWGSEGPGGIDAVAVLPGTPAFIIGNTWTAPAAGGGVFITADDDQGMAGYRVTGNDTNLRVLIMQLVVNQGEHVRGTIGVAWGTDGIIIQNPFVTGQTFSSIPGPSAVAALAAAGLFGSRRRRGNRAARGVKEAVQ